MELRVEAPRPARGEILHPDRGGLIRDAPYKGAAPADTATTPQMGDIYDVTVDVSWWAEDGTTSRRGYGLQKVTLKRTVYVEMSP